MSDQTVQEMPKGLSDHMKTLNIEKPAVTVESPKAPEVVAPVVAEQPVAAVPAKEVVAETSATTPTETPTPAPSQESWLDSNSSTTNAEAPKGASAEEKAAAFDKLMQDKEVLYFLEAKKAGKSLMDLSKDYQTVDYNAMPAEDVAKHYGKLLGLEDDQIEESISGINDMTPIQRQELISGWKEKLNKVQADSMESRIGDFRKSSEQDQLIMQKFDNDVAKEVLFIVDKEFFGAKLTKNDADDFQKWVRTDFANYINQDGTYNVPMLRNFWLGQVKIPTIQKANYAKGASEGRTEVLKEVHRPSTSSAVATSLPATKSTVNSSEKAAAALRQMMRG